MKKHLILFFGMIVFNNVGMAQLYHAEKVRLPLLDTECSSLSGVLDNVIGFESENCPSYTTDRNYFITGKITDSSTMDLKIIISSIGTSIALEISSGVYYRNDHPFFIHNSMIKNFVEMSSYTDFFKEIQNNLFDIDDTQTIAL